MDRLEDNEASMDGLGSRLDPTASAISRLPESTAEFTSVDKAVSLISKKSVM